MSDVASVVGSTGAGDVLTLLNGAAVTISAIESVIGSTDTGGMLTARFDFLRTYQRAGPGQEGAEEDEE